MNQHTDYFFDLDHFPAPMAIVSFAGDIAHSNVRFESLFGYAPGELLGKSIELLVPLDVRASHTKLREAFFNTPEPRAMGAGRDLQGVRKDGEQLPVEVGLDPIVFDGENLVIVSVIDISSRKKWEQELRLSNERLQQLNGELAEFAYSASHDLKAPLTSIAGILAYCESDIETGDIDEVRVNIQRARKLASRLAKRIEDILSIAKADKLSNEKEAIDVSEIVNRAWNALQADGVKLTTSFLHVDPFLSVPTRFVSIVENLVSNAVKYRDRDRVECSVHVRTWTEDGQFIMAVEDNGVGIPPEHRHRLFQRFQRISNNQELGSGLGLALVRKHVTILGGQVEMESLQGTTVFKVQLPMVNAQQA